MGTSGEGSPGTIPTKCSRARAAELHVETLAVAVHGALVILHLLGVAHNVRRRNRVHSIVHAAAAAYDLASVARHARAVRDLADP